MGLEDPLTRWPTPTASKLVLAVSGRPQVFSSGSLTDCSHNKTRRLTSPIESSLRDLGRSLMSFTAYPWKAYITSTDFLESHDLVLSQYENGPPKCLSMKTKGSLEAMLETGYHIT